MNINSLTVSDARKILKALATGSAPAEYARLLLVGQKLWLDTAMQLIAETSEDQDFEVRFVRARYGGGKTHFLYCVEQEARKRNWVTSFVLLKRDLVELDRFSSFVCEVIRNISLPNGNRGGSSLLKQAMGAHSAQYGLIPGKTLSLMMHDQAKRGILDYCSQNYVSVPFQTALRAIYSAHLEGDSNQLEGLIHWFAGTDSNVAVEKRHLVAGAPIKLKSIGPNQAEEHLRIIALLCQLAGYAGLLISVDELELIGRLPNQRKANSFQTLRALVDQNNSRLQPPATCLFLAATPEMFEDPDKFPSYKALQDRIENLPDFVGTNSVNYRATVIDLDRTALDKNDLHSLANMLTKLYRLAYGQLPDDIDAKLDGLVSQVITGNYLMARPRLLCRCVTDLLNGSLFEDLSAAVGRRAREMQEIHEKALTGR